jgi:hypothetical protein
LFFSPEQQSTIERVIIVLATLETGVTVEGCFGAIEPPVTNPDGTSISKRIKRRKIRGIILIAIDHKQWNVRFEDGKERVCFSTTLRLISQTNTTESECERVVDPVVANNNSGNKDSNDSNEDYSNSNTTSIDKSTEPQPVPEGSVDNERQRRNLEMQDNDNNEDGNNNNFNVNEVDEEVQQSDIIIQGYNEEVKQEEEIVEGMNHDIDFDVMDYVPIDVHVQRRQLASSEKQKLLADNWSVTKNNYVWKIVNESVPAEIQQEYEVCAVRTIDWNKFIILQSTMEEYAIESKKKSFA